MEQIQTIRQATTLHWIFQILLAGLIGLVAVLFLILKRANHHLSFSILFCTNVWLKKIKFPMYIMYALSQVVAKQIAQPLKT